MILFSQNFGTLSCATIVVLSLWINTAVNGDDCRVVQFREETQNRILAKHVIRSEQVLDKDVCELKCYLEPNCVSYNYGPLGGGTFICELSNKTHLQVSSSDLEHKDDYIYSPIINFCESSPCLSHSTCQTGFGDHGYRCVCPDGYQGDKCQTDWKKINIDPICFGTKNDDYGPFSIQEAGQIYTFKLVHKNGSVTCDTNYPSCNWGCRRSQYGTHNLLTVITYSNRTVLPLAQFVKGGSSTYYTYQLDGADVNSQTLVFNLLPTPLVVSVGQEFQIWYGHDLLNYTEYNNIGETCADVYGLYPLN